MKIERFENNLEKIVGILTWTISFTAFGGIIGFIFPLVISQDAQAGLISVFLGSPMGLLIGMSVGLSIGIYRSKKHKTNKTEHAVSN